MPAARVFERDCNEPRIRLAMLHVVAAGQRGNEVVYFKDGEIMLQRRAFAVRR